MRGELMEHGILLVTWVLRSPGALYLQSTNVGLHSTWFSNQMERFQTVARAQPCSFFRLFLFLGFCNTFAIHTFLTKWVMLTKVVMRTKCILAQEIYGFISWLSEDKQFIMMKIWTFIWSKFEQVTTFIWISMH